MRDINCTETTLRPVNANARMYLSLQLEVMWLINSQVINR